MHDRQLRAPADAGKGPITIDTAAIPAHVREDLACRDPGAYSGNPPRNPEGVSGWDAKKAELAAK